MAIFKKISPLEGNPCRSNGVAIEFKGLFHITENEDDIEFLSQFKCYEQISQEDYDSFGAQVPKKAEPKAATGVISAAKLAGIAAQNK